MKVVALFDAKPYDKLWFEPLAKAYDIQIKYYENKLNKDTAIMAKKCDGIIAFVNDEIDKETIERLMENKIEIIAMRCAGYNNVDMKAAYKNIHIVRVPAYSPYAVAEHAMALLLTLNRKIHRAYNRTRDYNFSINGLTGFDLHGKTIGIVGTGKIGRTFMEICRGFGLRIIAFDPYPVAIEGISYVSFETLCGESDMISLHCPLTEQTHHIINSESIKQMKNGVIIINTSRGALIESEALVEALKTQQIAAAGLDVYEEEEDFFFEDLSNTVIQDDTLARLVSLPNVIVTSHQAFLTNEALQNIAETTLENLNEYFEKGTLKNEICYHCMKQNNCDKKHQQPCFEISK